MRTIFLLAALVMVVPTSAIACKVMVVYPEHLDVDTPKHYYVVKIEKATLKVHSHGSGAATGNEKEIVIQNGESSEDSFTGIVVRSFGGHFRTNRTVTVRFEPNEEPHAICPVDLAVGETYLLHSESLAGAMLISHYDGFNLPSSDKRFNAYVRDLADSAER